MKRLRKHGVLTLSAIISFGLLAPAVSATPLTNDQEGKIQIRIANTESVVTKGELIEKLKKLFPNKFDFLNESDFYMSSGHHYPDDDTIRYDLNFHKNINGQQVYGNVGFVGSDLQIERYYYDPVRTVDSLFPPKVTKEEAEKIASTFLNKFANQDDYQLNTNQYYYPGNLTLTEPIRYSFSFVRTKNDVPISDQQIQVTVLGNGEVVDFYRNLANTKSQTYDDVTKVRAENDILAQVKENLSIDLQYLVNYDYQTGERNVKLVYQPTSGILGVHALTGKWQTINEFSDNLPEKPELKLITTKPTQPKYKDFSVEKAKAFAKKLLAIDSDKITLSIESIDEGNNYNGQEVITIQYSYQYKNGGYGSDLQLDKQTGEIIQYHDLKSEVLEQVNEETKSGKTITREKALEQAVKYLKEFAPSYLHNYAMPIEETYFEDERGVYYFNFPRVVNGILVSGDQIFVTVSQDGSLLGFNVNYQDIENWPSNKEIISKDEAAAEFMKELSLDLHYAKNGHAATDNHYDLVYTPVFKDGTVNFLDANTGKWDSIVGMEGETQVVSHPWAEDELNFLINAGILKVEDVNTFNADAQVTKGDAIEVIMKSLNRFYEGHYPGQENMSQSFENIGPEHPLYQVIERAVEMGILDTENPNFPQDKQLTREELAVWYIRAMGLESAAKDSSIYQLEFADVNNIQAEYIGYVALANSLGLLIGNNHHFYPDRGVTYAELAVSIFRLAHEVYAKEL